MYINIYIHVHAHMHVHDVPEAGEAPCISTFKLPIILVTTLTWFSNNLHYIIKLRVHTYIYVHLVFQCSIN